MNKRIKQKEETRQKIMFAAKHCYGEKGFQVATKEIALAASVSHGSIFSHFPTADLLCQAVLSHYFTKVGEQMDATMREGTDLRIYLLKWIELIQGDAAFYSRLSSEISLLSDECQAIMIGFQTALGVDIEWLLKKQNQESSLKDIPLAFLVNTWIGISHYYIQNNEWFTIETNSQKEMLVDYYLLLIRK